MSFVVQSINIDFSQDRATVQIHDQANQNWVSASVKINTPGDQGEAALKQLARAAARQAHRKPWQCCTDGVIGMIGVDVRSDAHFPSAEGTPRVVFPGGEF